MASEAAKAAIAKVAAECESGGRLCPQKVGAAMQAMRQTLRDADLAATELAYQLAEVADHDERQAAVREMENKVTGLKGRIDHARKHADRVEASVREIERDYPRIAETLGVEA